MAVPFEKNLSGLVDFEAAARRLSFRLAAEELNKTPAAVSYQIKQLELAVGFPLFDRYPRHVSLTEKGRGFAVALSRTLKELRSKVAELQSEDHDAILTVTTTHSFALKWLAPRLHLFTRLHPSIDLRVIADDGVNDLSAGGVDVALRYCRTCEDESESLLCEKLIVVYSPDIQGQEKPRHPDLAWLLQQNLLYEGSTDSWLQLLDRENLHRERRFTGNYSHAGLLVQAAAAGHGVALVPHSLAYEDVKNGRLQMCKCEPLPSAWGYVLMRSTNLKAKAKADRFEDWVRSEVEVMTKDFV
jgi:LysR family transcriptional regulator, glycine cleavage system transcriptional activator